MKIWKIILVGVLFLGITERVEAAGLSLKRVGSGTLESGQEFETVLSVDLLGEEITGTDVVLRFDKTKLQLVDITLLVDGLRGTFLPADGSGNFKEEEVVNKANSSGELEVGWVTYNWGGTVTAPLTTKTDLLRLKFKAVAAGETRVDFVFEEGMTIDSNVVVKTNSGVIDALDGVTNLVIDVNNSSGCDCVNGIGLKEKGDANCDGDIGIADFAMWRNGFVEFKGTQEKKNYQADFNCDLSVTMTDFVMWRNGFVGQN